MKSKLFGALFALPFLAVGIVAGYFLVTDLASAWKMRNWMPLRAHIESAGYETSAGDDADTYKAFARYRYVVDDVTYRNDRVAITGGSDNFREFQQKLGRRLQEAMANGESVEIYVDPDYPEQAVVHRTLRWGMAGFQLFFVVIFGGIGAGLLYATFRLSVQAGNASAVESIEPWLSRPAWANNEIRSSSRSTMWVAWGFALFWCLISAPLPFAVIEEVQRNGNMLAWLGLLFPVIGAGLVAWAFRRTLEWRRFGSAPVTLDPFPGAIGGHVGGQIDCRMSAHEFADITVTLSCLRSYVSGSGKSRSRKESALWQDTQRAHAGQGPLGSRLTFRFQVPEALAESDADTAGGDYILWRLNIRASLPGADLDRDYDIPVYETKATSKTLPRHSLDAARAGQKAQDLAAIRRLCRFEFAAGGRALFYPIGRHLTFGVTGSVFGAVFAVSGYFLATRADAWFMAAAFAAVGLLILLSSLYLMLNSLEVRQEGDALVATRRLLGIRVNSERMQRDAFSHFDTVSTMSSQSGSRHVMHYSLKAFDHDGRTMIVGEGFKGASQANLAAELVAEEFGLTQRSAGAEADGMNILAAD